MNKVVLVVIEFLAGLFLLPWLINIVFGLILGAIGFGPSVTLVYIKIIEAILILVLFFFRKAVAIGYLFNFLIELVGVYSIIGNILN